MFFKRDKSTNNKSTPTTKVKMINSVDSYVGGLEYDIPANIANDYIAKGYATGEFNHEIGLTKTAPSQNITFGGN